MSNRFSAWKQALRQINGPQFRFFLLFNFCLIALSALWLWSNVLPLPLIEMNPFDRLLCLQDMPAVWATALVMLLSLLLLPFWNEETLARLLAFVNQYIYWITAASFVFYALLAHFMYLRHPLSMDEYCLVFQSHIFASGRLTGQIPPDLIDFVVHRPFQAGFFTVNHQNGAVLSTYWPGTSLLMLPFALLGAPWLYNPAISALTVFVAHRIVRRWSGSAEAAAWVVIFLLASPVITINAASFFAMPSHLLLNLLFCGLMLYDQRKAAFVAGLIGGFAFSLHNPFPHFAFAIPWMLYVLKYNRKLLLPLVAGYFVFGTLLCIGWVFCLSWATASDSLARNAGKSSNGVIASLNQVFAFPSASLLISRISALVKVLLWASPGLVAAFAFLWRKQEDRKLRVLAWSLFTTFLIYLFVNFDQGQGWGFRYLHSAWFALPVIAALALANKGAKATEKSAPGLFEKRAVERWLSLAAILSFFIVLPVYIVTTRTYMVERVSQVPTPPENKRAILFLNPQHGDHLWDLAQNDPFLRNRVWRLITGGKQANAKIVRKYLPGATQVAQGKWGEMWVKNEH